MKGSRFLTSHRSLDSTEFGGGKVSFRRLVALALAAVSISMIGMGLGSRTVSAEPPVRDVATGTGTDNRAAAVSPGTALTNEVVTVSWSGFTQSGDQGQFAVLIVQCKQNPVSLADCYTAEAYPSIANGNRVLSKTAPDGTGSTRIEIRPASYLPLLNCSSTNPCSLMIYENDGLPIPEGGLPTKRSIVPITFAPSQADCPTITDFDVRADGSATSAALFYGWAAQLCRGDDAVVVDYTENSSNTGRENFLNGLTDFGVSGLPATAEELEDHPDHREFSYVPLVASAVVIAYNFTDPQTKEPFDDLVLSPRLVARFITDTQLEDFFRDRELRKLNQGFRLPTGLARPLLRAERNADTRIVTNWFSSNTSAQKFLAGTKSDDFKIDVNAAYVGYSYPQDLFETVAQDNAYFPRQGQRTISLKMFYGVTATGNAREDTTTTGFIGVMDLPSAKRFGLKVAKIGESRDTAVAPTDATILAGLADMDTSPEGLLIADPTPEDPTAYPLVKVDYAMVPNEFSTQRKVDKVTSLLRYGLTEGQNSLAAGYVALPDSMKVDALASLSQISATPTTTTIATATTVVSTTVASDIVVPTSSSTTTPLVPISQELPNKYVPSATTAAPETTLPESSTTSTSTTTTSSTSLAPITVPNATSDLPGSGSSKSGMLYTGLLGLSGAALVGTAKPRKKGAQS